MQDINAIKNAVTELYNEKKEIHVEVHSKKPKINILDSKAHITGVYRNLFTIEVIENGLKKSYTVPYTDMFIGRVKIKEL